MSDQTFHPDIDQTLPKQELPDDTAVVTEKVAFDVNDTTLLESPTDPIDPEFEQIKATSEQVTVLAQNTGLALESLIKLSPAVERTLEGRGLTGNENGIVETSLQYLAESIGVTRPAQYTAESTKSFSNLRRAEMTLEGIGDFIRAIIEGIKRLFQKAVQVVKEFMLKLDDRAKKLLAWATKMRIKIGSKSNNEAGTIRHKAYNAVLSQGGEFGGRKTADSFVAYIGKADTPSAVLEDASERFGAAYARMVESITDTDSFESNLTEFTKKIGVIQGGIKETPKGTPEGLSVRSMELPFNDCYLYEYRIEGAAEDAAANIGRLKLWIDRKDGRRDYVAELDGEEVESLSSGNCLAVCKASETYLKNYISSGRGEKTIREFESAAKSVNRLSGDNPSAEVKKNAQTAVKATTALIAYLTGSAAQLLSYDFKVIGAGLAYVQDSLATVGNHEQDDDKTVTV